MRPFILIVFLGLILSLNVNAQDAAANLDYNNSVRYFNQKDYSKVIEVLKESADKFPEFVLAQRLMAESYKQMDDEENTRKYYKRIVAEKPNDKEIWFNISTSYVRSKDLDNAEKAAKRALEIDPTYEKASRRLELIADYKRKAQGSETAAPAADSKEEGKEPETGTTQVKQNTTQDPQAKKYVKKGIGFYNEKQFLQASTAFEKALTIESRPQVLVFAGRSNLHLNKVDEAIAQLKQAVASDSDNGEYHYYLSVAHGQKGNEDASERHLKMAKERGFPGTTEVFNSEARKHYNAGVDFYQDGKYLDAVQSYQKAIKIDPDNPKFLYNISVAYYQMERDKEAEKAVEELFEYEPTHALGYELLGKIYYDREQWKKAGRFTQEAINYGENTAANHILIADCYDKMENPQKAKVYFLEANELEPDNADVLFNIGMSSYKMENYTDAENYFRKAIEVKPLHQKALLNLSSTLFHVGKLNESMTYAEKYRDEYPNDGRVYEIMGNIYNNMGEYELRDKFYRRAKDLGYK